MKNGPPNKVVNTPTGISVANITLEILSAKTNITPPSRPDNGINALLSEVTENLNR